MRKTWIVAALLLAGCGGTEDDVPGESGGVAAEEAAPAACGKDSWKSYAGKFFRAECARCHGGEFASAAAVKSSRARELISAGKMPQDKPLTAAQKRRILAWFSCGAR